MDMREEDFIEEMDGNKHTSNLEEESSGKIETKKEVVYE